MITFLAIQDKLNNRHYVRMDRINAYNLKKTDSPYSIHSLELSLNMFGSNDFYCIRFDNEDDALVAIEKINKNFCII